MTNFKFVSTSIENIYSLSQQEIVNRICTIHLNKIKEIQIPLMIAVSISSTISQMLLFDPTMTDFYIDDHSLDDIQDSVYNKFMDLLSLKEIVLENEEIPQIAKIGNVLGNREIISFYRDFVKKYEENINDENVLLLVQQKVLFDLPIDELNVEIAFVSSNFSKLAEQLIDLGKDIKYYNFIECVVKHENVQLGTEDEMLQFILKLCQYSNIYDMLFEYVWFEYCSVESISQFTEYISKNLCRDNHLKSIFKCINRRLIHEIPVKNMAHNRYCLEKEYKYNVNDQMNGILRHEYLKGNVEMMASSTYRGDVYDLLKNSTEVDFCTENRQNSWIGGNIKNRKPFTISRYVIRGRIYKRSDGYNNLQSWKLEGHRISDGKWIMLDSHVNEPFDQLCVRSFEINNKDKFDAVRLSQLDSGTNGNNNLCINAFDIYGNTYTK